MSASSYANEDYASLPVTRTEADENYAISLNRRKRRREYSCSEEDMANEEDLDGRNRLIETSPVGNALLDNGAAHNAYSKVTDMEVALLEESDKNEKLQKNIWKFQKELETLRVKFDQVNERKSDYKKQLFEHDKNIAKYRKQKEMLQQISAENSKLKKELQDSRVYTKLNETTTKDCDCECLRAANVDLAAENDSLLKELQIERNLNKDKLGLDESYTIEQINDMKLKIVSLEENYVNIESEKDKAIEMHSQMLRDFQKYRAANADLIVEKEGLCKQLELEEKKIFSHKQLAATAAKEFDDQIFLYQSKYERLSTEKQKYSEECMALKKSLKDHTDVNAALIAQNKSLKKQLKQEKNSKKNQELQDYDNRIEFLTAQCESLSEEKDLSEENYSKLMIELKDSEIKIRQLEQRNTALKTQLRDVAAERDILKSDVQIANGRISQLNDNEPRLKGRIEDVEPLNEEKYTQPNEYDSLVSLLTPEQVDLIKGLKDSLNSNIGGNQRQCTPSHDSQKFSDSPRSFTTPSRTFHSGYMPANSHNNYVQPNTPPSNSFSQRERGGVSDPRIRETYQRGILRGKSSDALNVNSNFGR